MNPVDNPGLVTYLALGFSALSVTCSLLYFFKTQRDKRKRQEEEKRQARELNELDEALRKLQPSIDSFSNVVRTIDEVVDRAHRILNQVSKEFMDRTNELTAALGPLRSLETRLQEFLRILKDARAGFDTNAMRSLIQQLTEALQTCRTPMERYKPLLDGLDQCLRFLEIALVQMKGDKTPSSGASA